MKLRAVAALLAIAALSACDGSLLPRRELAGSWQSERETVSALFPDGARSLEGEVFLSFQEDGGFVMQTLLADGQRAIVESIEWGSFTASDGRARLTTTTRYLRGTEEPTSQPAGQPVAPTTREYQYEMSGGILTFVAVCPPNASCVAPRFTRYRSLRVE